MERKPPIYASTVIHLKRLSGGDFKWGYNSILVKGVILWSRESYGSEEEAINRAQEAFPNSRLKIEKDSEREI
jgi:hypothetical protein